MKILILRQIKIEIASIQDIDRIVKYGSIT